MRIQDTSEEINRENERLHNLVDNLRRDLVVERTVNDRLRELIEERQKFETPIGEEKFLNFSASFSLPDCDSRSWFYFVFLTSLFYSIPTTQPPKTVKV